MTDTKIEIMIIIAGYGLYAARLWPTVPRIGESIRIEGDKAGIYVVKDVVWSQDKNGNVAADLTVEGPI